MTFFIYVTFFCGLSTDTGAKLLTQAPAYNIKKKKNIFLLKTFE